MTEPSITAAAREDPDRIETAARSLSVAAGADRRGRSDEPAMIELSITAAAREDPDRIAIETAVRSLSVAACADRRGRSNEPAMTAP